MTTGAMSEEPAATESESSQSEQGSDDSIRVCVRFRPLTPSEVARHESEVWGKVDDSTVGVVGRFGITAKYAFDKVYGPESSNDEIYQNMVADLVDSVPDGICNTVFAYGVTSSGKTHTMHGTDEQPGVVTRALQQLFACAHGDDTRDYLIRISYVEIYNEIINDLLDPARNNLRVIEDPTKGQVVEGARECPILSAEEAMDLVAKGEAHRKVSATAANEGSSRSHTIVKVSVESTSTAKATSGPTRRLSALNLIDLAGSEAAKVQQSKEQSREGSYINRSLLALGTVIAKLGERNASHIPFRDSKLTRLLASSLSGRGARVCIVCTATPTAAQAEETHNTLKFAMRAKAVRVKATRNERSNTYELLMRYQQEVADLRQQLWRVQQGQGLVPRASLQPVPCPWTGPGTPGSAAFAQSAPSETGEVGVDLASLQEVLALREQLEEERAVRVMYEREREELKARIVRLTRLAMNSGQFSQPGQLLPEAQAQDDGDQEATQIVEVEVWRAEQSLGLTQNGSLLGGEAGVSYDQANAEFDMSDYHNVIMSMREQMLTLQDELMERDRQISDLRTHGESILANASMIRIEAERERDASEAEASVLAGESVGEVGGWQDPQVLQDDYQALERQLQVAMEENEKLRRARASSDSETMRRLQSMEEQVQLVVQELTAKEKQLEAERKTLRQFQELEQQVEMQLNETSKENTKLRLELQRLETNNNRLQGYELDSMSGNELSHLVRSLTQAVERVRVTVQMRRLAAPSPPDVSPRAAGVHAAPPSLESQQPQPQWPFGSRSPEAAGRAHSDGQAARKRSPPPPLILTGGIATEAPRNSAASSPLERQTSRDLNSQELNDLHKAMPLRRPKPYNYSRTPDSGTTPRSTTSSGPSTARSLQEA